MALSQKHRSSLHLSLAPVVGTEEAEALLAEFPATYLNVPATKEFVRTEVQVSVGALRAEMHQLFRRQTIWFAGIMLTCLSASTAVSAAVVMASQR